MWSDAGGAEGAPVCKGDGPLEHQAGAGGGIAPAWLII